MPDSPAPSAPLQVSDGAPTTRRTRRGKGWWTALALLAAIAAYALVVPVLVPHDSRIVDYAASWQPPSLAHPMGTDAEGRDLFVRVAIGLRLSLAIAFIVALVATTVGVAVGLIAGFTGGIVDRVLMRTADTVNALPHLILGLVIVAMFRGDVLAIVLAMVVTHWVTIARIVRAQALSLRHSDLVSVAWLSGMGRTRIIVHHVAPAAFGQAMISVVLTVPHIVWHESTFSFLGIGLPPHEPSLGTLLAEAQGAILLGNWWTLAFPGGVLVAATLTIGVIGRALTTRQEFL